MEEVIERERREEFTQQVRSFHADITVLQDSFKVSTPSINIVIPKGRMAKYE